jgi:hypothetical protein
MMGKVQLHPEAFEKSGADRSGHQPVGEEGLLDSLLNPPDDFTLTGLCSSHAIAHPVCGVWILPLSPSTYHHFGMFPIKHAVT